MLTHLTLNSAHLTIPGEAYMTCLISLTMSALPCISLVALLAPRTDQNRVLQKIGELNLRQGTSAFSKFGCKNEG